MSFVNCIKNNTFLTPKQKKSLADEYDVYYKKYTASTGNANASSLAAQEFMLHKVKVLSQKKKNSIGDVIAWVELNKAFDLNSAKYNKLRDDATFTKYLWGKSGKSTAARQILEDTYTSTITIERNAQNSIWEQLSKFKTKFAGITRDTVGFKNVVREMLGDDTGDDFSKMSGKAIRDVFDKLHKMYEQAGGIVGKLDNYFPQRHNANLIKRAGFDVWKKEILDSIDINKMINDETSMPFSPQELDAMLPKIYDNIITNGLNDVALRADEGKQTFGRGGGTAMRHSASRFFHFKDANAFLNYNKKFGVGDEGLFDAMMHHIHTMSRDIGIMQQLGPKPEAQIARLNLKLQSEGVQNIKTFNGMYDVLSGRNSYDGTTGIFYNTTMGVQNILRSALLGGAPVAAIGDSFFAAMASKMNGIPVGKTLKSYVGMLNPLDAGDRRIAARNGFAATSVNGQSITGARFTEDADGHGVTGWMAAFTNRASGLGSMTDAVKNAPVISAMGFLAELKHTKTNFIDLPPAMLEAFDRWGIDKSDFDNFMKADFHRDVDSPADFIRPEEIAKVSVESAAKLDLWLTDMAMLASNEPRLITRAITTGAVAGEAKSGTLLRGTATSIMMFKSFGISMTVNHLIPAMRRMETAKGFDRFSRLGALTVGTTVLGAAALQLRSVMYGKTPQDMSNGKFWQSAMLQGGGAGIFGDFLFSDQSRFGNSIIETAAGPVVGTAADLFKVFKGNFDKALDEGTETKFFADLFQFGKTKVPMVKLWYTRLLLERTVQDSLERAIDPNFDTRMRRIESKMESEKGQEFWWGPNN